MKDDIDNDIERLVDVNSPTVESFSSGVSPKQDPVCVNLRLIEGPFKFLACIIKCYYIVVWQTNGI